ncbi:hypothetical protein WICANDRAFT_79157 [Wickerhamomyces anomalus NRRL Y-366-8]|uniref:Glutaredoxin domain-containing protein n=1 Tax=Wickerhamomyces anomalus (strain ATCC 58044 / CBS 1984 / NCYC 433 / NRRL Y-366-8) TaxID=683960 RepID=A0A1E3NZI7_WICAA|nr:uncharacterized protein WICANDRAFT_79157 [Wickerhamomyces anomalus NRRL Y-366-8]ODQ58609.1 hypothetical protein WICANDRAFT_79157 [Wickerhamomyces anomalus NRRL Y-366-8]
MVSSRKSRILALSAFLLTVVFIVIQTHNHKVTNTTVAGSKSQGTNIEPTTKIGVIDESKIKSNEEKIKNKLQSNEDKDESNVEIKQKQQQKPNKDGTKDNTNTPVSSEFDAASELQSILGLSPVVIFSKTYCGYSQTLKNLLKSEYEINPPPTIVELDKHKNGRQLQDFIGTKTGRKTVPNLFINGVSRGGSDDIKKLHEEGKLLNSLNLWGDKDVKVNKINAPSNS